MSKYIKITTALNVAIVSLYHQSLAQPSSGIALSDESAHSSPASDLSLGFPRKPKNPAAPQFCLLTQIGEKKPPFTRFTPYQSERK
ncbi:MULTISPECIES: hypothetical protein [unclassified Microcoleus]|uniref:hypothetical protein n=1 Tax=unclassified Microcoleus TaxID=2642155 RepID=UPI002FD1C556